MAEVPVPTLQQAIRDLHGCDSTWIESVPVKEDLLSQPVWEGTVQVFELHGHPTATRCYAWSHETDEGKRRFVAVLHEPAVNSPEKAVRAAIVQESQTQESQTLDWGLVELLGAFVGGALATALVVAVWVNVEPTGTIQVRYILLFILASAAGGGILAHFLVKLVEWWKWRSE